MILALGRAGEPRKLGVKGEDLPKVMYRLIEADHYINKKILIVGGGDSAVEAAMGLASQTGNKVTLSYRSERFSRIKERNCEAPRRFHTANKLKVLFNSNPVEFKPGNPSSSMSRVPNRKSPTIMSGFLPVAPRPTPSSRKSGSALASRT